MSYTAIKNFTVKETEFKIGDNVPFEFVEARLIRAKKIALDYGEVQEVQEVTEVQEILTETIPTQIENVEILTEDSSDVKVITEEVEVQAVEVQAVEVQAVEVKPSKKSKAK